jgi:hypothetical protein
MFGCSLKLLSLDDEEGRPVQFRRTLLNKCQEEFESGANAMKAVAEREKREKGEAEPTTPVEDLEDGEITEDEQLKRDAGTLGEN